MSQKIKPSPQVFRVQSHFKASLRRASYGHAWHLHPIRDLHEQDPQTLWHICHDQSANHKPPP